MTLTERVHAAYLEECRETGCYLGSERKAKRRIRATILASEATQSDKDSA
jgi:hypothetical protein